MKVGAFDISRQSGKVAAVCACGSSQCSLD